MSDWVWLYHADNKSYHRFPADPDVVRAYEGRGWALTDHDGDDTEPPGEDAEVQIAAPPKARKRQRVTVTPPEPEAADSGTDLTPQEATDA